MKLVEYLLNVIRITAGSNEAITAVITEEDNTPINDGCRFVLFDKDENKIAEINGEYVEATGLWQFDIPAELTKDFCGRYWYRVCVDGSPLCFRQPIYFCN